MQDIFIIIAKSSSQLRTIPAPGRASAVIREDDSTWSLQHSSLRNLPANLSILMIFCHSQSCKPAGLALDCNDSRHLLLRCRRCEFHSSRRGMLNWCALDKNKKDEDLRVDKEVSQRGAV